MRIALPFLVLALGGCHPVHEVAWTGYAFEDRDLEGTAGVYGPYPTLKECSGALLVLMKDRPRTALACGQGCPSPRRTDMEGCTTTVTIDH